MLSAAKTLGYIPDAAARTLASGQTRTLGLVLPDSHHLEVDAFIPQLLYSLTEASNVQGFRVIVEGVREARKDAYRALAYAKQIDGLVILNPRLDDLDSSLPDLITSGFPVVFVSNIDHPKAYTVTQKTADGRGRSAPGGARPQTHCPHHLRAGCVSGCPGQAPGLSPRTERGRAAHRRRFSALRQL